MEYQIQYNSNSSVNVLFDKAAEWYLIQLPMLENYHLKSQSRQVTSSLIKSEILTIEHVQGAVNF